MPEPILQNLKQQISSQVNSLIDQADQKLKAQVRVAKKPQTNLGQELELQYQTKLNQAKQQAIFNETNLKNQISELNKQLEAAQQENTGIINQTQEQQTINQSNKEKIQQELKLKFAAEKEQLEAEIAKLKTEHQTKVTELEKQAQAHSQKSEQEKSILEQRLRAEFEKKLEIEADKLCREKNKQKLAQISPLGVAARKEKKQENLEKILKLTKEKGQITHKLVETELKISESNTTNYLNELVSQGKLIAEGETSNRIFKSKLP